MTTFTVHETDIELVGQGAGTLAEASAALPPGVYTTLRTYGGRKVLRLEEHVARLESSAALLGCRLVLDRARLRSALRSGVEAAGFADSRVRITAAFARGGRPGEVFLTYEPLALPDPRLYERGVRAASIPLARELPRAKSTAFIAVAAEYYARKPPDVYEYVMVSPEGALLEGLTSNFFAVRGGALYTAGEGVLAGVTRAIVLEVAAGYGHRVIRMPVHRDELPGLDEAFITSASRALVPVVAIDDVTIGNGRPGAVTQQLSAGYRTQVDRELEEL